MRVITIDDRRRRRGPAPRLRIASGLRPGKWNSAQHFAHHNALCTTTTWSRHLGFPGIEVTYQAFRNSERRHCWRGTSSRWSPVGRYTDVPCRWQFHEAVDSVFQRLVGAASYELE